MLSREKRDDLIGACESTYKAYAALDFAKDKKTSLLNIDGEQITLNDFFIKKIKQYEAAGDAAQHIFTAVIEGLDYQITLGRDPNGVYQCRLAPVAGALADTEFKAMEKFTTQDKLNLFCHQSFIVEKDRKGDDALGLYLHKSQQVSYQLGGANKVDLYRDHLGTLYKIHKRLKKGESLSNILIALATGAGKTFVQAMWLLVLDMANLNGVFALPNRLLKQFIGDVAKLLPSNLADKICTLEQFNPEENKKAQAVLDDWGRSAENDAKFVVASYEELLDKEYPRLQALQSSERETSEVAFSFDEQHEVIQDEARKLKFLDLATHHLTMMLTATPTKETYQLCNQNPVARMSNHQKAKQGHGVFPKLSKQRDKTLGDKKSELKKPLSFMEEIWHKIASLFQSERSSPIITQLEALQYANPASFMHTEGVDLTDYHQRRWNYQPPISRKILVICDDHEELINLHNFLKKTDELGDQRRLDVRIIPEPPYFLNEHKKIREFVKILKNSDNTFSFFKKNGEWYVVSRYSTVIVGPIALTNLINSENLSTLSDLLDKGSLEWNDHIRQQIFNIMDKPGCRKFCATKIYPNEEVPGGFYAGFVRQEDKLSILDEWGYLQKELKLTSEQLAEFDRLINPPISPAMPVELDKAQIDAISAISGIEFPWGTSLVNEIYAREYAQSVYQNGNTLSREKIFMFLNNSDPDVDAKISAEFRKLKEERGKQQAEEAGLSMPPITLAGQLDRNIFSGIAEYLFSDLTGLDTISLNIMRKDDFAAAKALINQKIEEKTLTIVQQCNDQQEFSLGHILDACKKEFAAKLTYDPQDKKKEKGLDPEGAAQVATMLAHMLVYYHTLNDEEKTHFIENWTLENKGRDNLLANDHIRQAFSNYTDTHRVMYVVSGMEEAETPIRDHAPFTGFDETQLKISQGQGQYGKKPKIRDHELGEDFDPGAIESQFTPVYGQDITETIADNYSKLGFIGMYVGNKKTEGYSDLNLHTVISTVTDSGSVNNNPTKQVQGVGRPRGKDPTQKPYYFSCVKKGVELAFDLERLNKPEDYYPAFFEAKRKYNRLALKSIGKRIAKDISRYLKEEMNAYDSIENNAYNRGLQLILLSAFREIYNNCNHEMELSKKYFHRALRYANIEMQRKVKKIRDPYTVKGEISVFASVISGVHKLQYYKKSGAKRKELRDKAVELRKKSTVAPHTLQEAKVLLYADIIEKTDYVSLKEKKITFYELFNLLQKKQSYIEQNLLAMIESKFSDDNKEEINKKLKEFFLPLLAKYVNPEKQAYCLEQANKYNNWHTLFLYNRNLLEEFAESEPEAQAQLAIKIFQKVPSLTFYLNPQNDQFAYSPQAVQVLLKPLGDQVAAGVMQGVSENLAEYFSGDFLKELKPLLMIEDYLLIREVLEDQERAKQFVAYLHKKNGEINDKTPQNYIALFVSFCQENHLPREAEIAQIKMMDQRGGEAQAELQAVIGALDKKMKENRAAVLTEASYVAMANLLYPEEITELNAKCQTEFLLGMLLFLNDEVRAETYARLKTYDKWHELLFKFVDDNDFKNFTELNPNDSTSAAKMTTLFIKMLNATGQVNLGADVGRDYKAVCEAAKKEIEEDLEKLSSWSNIISQPTAIIGGFWNYLKSGRQDFTKNQQIQFLANYLNGGFSEKIEPFFYPDDLATLRGILSNHDICVDLAKFLLNKKEAADNADKTAGTNPASAIDNIKEFFLTYQNGKYKESVSKIVIAPTRFAAVGDYLKEKSSNYSTDIRAPIIAPLTCFKKHPARAKEILDTLEPTSQEAVKKVMIEKLLPIFLCCVKNEAGRHERIKQACGDYTNWISLLSKHQKQLEKLEIDNLPAVVFALLKDIPALSDLTVENDSVNIKQAVDGLTETFNKVAEISPPFNVKAVENVSQILLEKIDSLRYLLLEDDWRIIKEILLEPGNINRFAEKLIAKQAFDLEALAESLHELFSAHPLYPRLHCDAAGKIAFIDQMQNISAPQLNSLKTIFANLYQAATPAEKAKVFKQEVISMFSLNAFSKALIDSVPLSEENLGAMLSFFDQRNIKSKLPDLLKNEVCVNFKADILQLIALLKEKNYEKIFDLYFKGDLTQILDATIAHLADPSQPAPQFEQSKFLKLFVLIQQIGAEQIRCHEFFNKAKQNATTEESWLAPTLNADVKSIKVNDDTVEHFDIFGTAALRSSMPLNSELSGAKNKRTADLLEATASHVVAPLMETIDERIELRALPTRAGTSTFAKMRESAQALGERIVHLTAMKAEDVNLGSRYCDAIDVLIQPVVGNVQLPSLSVWWLNRMKQVRSMRGFYRSQEISDIDHFINYVDITSNQSLMRGYELTTKFLRNVKNEIFSDYYSDIHQLRRQIYGHMVLNTAKVVLTVDPNFYKEMLNDIKLYLCKTAGLQDVANLAQHRFNSTTFNKIKNILLNDKLDDCDKLLRIQFLARDFRKDPMRNLRRNTSHFFSGKKTEEGVFVREFCTALGKTMFHDEKNDMNGIHDRHFFKNWIKTKSIVVPAIVPPQLGGP